MTEPALILHGTPRDETPTGQKSAPLENPAARATAREDLSLAPDVPQTTARAQNSNRSSPQVIAPDPDQDPRAFWAAVAGVEPDRLVFPPARGGGSATALLHRHPRIEALVHRALHLWRCVWFGPHLADPPARPIAPLNLAPWTHDLLSDPRKARGARGTPHLWDRLIGYLSHPDTRFETHAWRMRRRAQAHYAERFRAGRALLAGRSAPEDRTSREAKDDPHV